jgi:hypothetical protein
VSYRDDLDAAHARVTALEHEVAQLRERPPLDTVARGELVELRTENWQLRVDLARAREDEQRATALAGIRRTPPDRDAAVVAQLERENAGLREALRAGSAALAKINDERDARAPRPARSNGRTGSAALLLALVALVVLAVVAASDARHVDQTPPPRSTTYSSR